MHALDLEDEAAEKRERLEEKAAIAKALEQGNEDAASIVERVRTVHLKKSSMRRQNQEQKARELAAAMNAPAFTFAGLKTDEDEDTEMMDTFDPLDGMEVDNQYIVYRDAYENLYGLAPSSSFFFSLPNQTSLFWVSRTYLFLSSQIITLANLFKNLQMARGSIDRQSDTSWWLYCFTILSTCNI